MLIHSILTLLVYISELNSKGRHPQQMIIVIKLKKSGSPADKGTKTKRLPPGLINGSSLGTEQFLPWN